MVKKFSIFVISLFAIGLLVSPALAAGKSAQAGKSNVAHLYLYEKNPADWTIVQGGAWGKMKYNLSGSEFDFVFNGHGLLTDSPIAMDYTLIYYPDPWPGAGLICLGSGTADEFGNVNIKGTVDTGELSAAKIWLVLSSDVKCEEGSGMTAWNPTEYLFEYDLIKFEDTDE